jgi:hypothetical protein
MTLRPKQPVTMIGTLVTELLGRQGLAGKCREYLAWQVWEEVVGPQIASRAQPVRMRDGVLEVRVEQPVWMQQLQLLKPGILLRLNARLGNAAIKDIFWRRGKIENQNQPSAEDAGLPWRIVPFTEADQSVIEAAMAPVTDPELKASIRRFLTHQAKLEKARKQAKE